MSTYIKNYAGNIKKIHFKRTYLNENGRTIVEMGCKIENQTYCFAWSYNIDEVTCKKCLKKAGVK